MEKKTITISGLPGSGTTTVAKMLAEKTNLKYINVGMIFREMAEKNKMSLEFFEKYCEKHPEIDIELDKKQEEMMRKGNIIMEGRLSGWIAHLKKIPAFKVWLDCDEKERIRRVIEREGGDFFEKKMETKKRIESEKRRYKKFYGIDINDKSIYDLVIDTTNMPPEEIVKKILEAIKDKHF
ncbi:MAG: cytidylate kinase [Thermoplasmata archaeon]|nr:MAG: cytidylate kinase [Thermoplasmata archaeon]